MSAHDAGPITAHESNPKQGELVAQRFWPERWWLLVDWRIGIIPIPIYALLVILVATLVQTGEIKSDGPTMIAVLVLGGFTCAEIGKRLPILRHIGAAAIFATFIPSALVYYHLIPTKIESSIVEFTKSTNLLYLFIAAIIVGSILGMDRDVLIKGFLKIFIPLSVGSVVAAMSVPLWALRSASAPLHTFFYIVVPIMAGGVGEGAIPLSIGYARTCITAGRDLRPGSAAGHAGQPDRHPAVGHAELRRQEVSEARPAKVACNPQVKARRIHAGA